MPSNLIALRRVLILGATIGTLCTFDVSAQSSYDKSIKSAQSVGSLDNNAFGDAVNHYTGQLSFNVTDLTIPGNNALKVAATRSYSAEFGRLHASEPDPAAPLHLFVEKTRQYLLGDWDLEIPHIGGTFAEDIGWQHNSTTPQSRCSVLAQVKADGTPAKGEPVKLDPKYPGDFWNGNYLQANGSNQTLILATNTTIPRPTGASFHWTTKDNWWVSCVPAANAEGEGFLAIDPTGTKYRFDWMSSRNVGEISDVVDLGNGKYQQFNTYLLEVMFLPTRIEDRFGNYVEYTYSSDAFARPMTITSPDGRSLTFSYNGQNLVQSVTDGTRTVRYAYTQTTSGPSLSTVTFDDLSSWTYQFAGLANMQASSQYDPEDLCAQPYPPLGTHPDSSTYECVGYPASVGGGTGTVTHPSGATATYVLQTHFHLQDTTGYGVSYPLSVAEKTITGPGLPTRKWSYAFSPGYDEVKAQCLAGACPTRIWTDEIRPDYRVTRRMFGLQSQVDQGQLVQQLDGYYPVPNSMVSAPTVRVTRMDRINGTDPDIVADSSPVTTVSESPVFEAGTNFYYHMGELLGSPPGDYPPPEKAYLYMNFRHLPILQKITNQDGRTFTNLVLQWGDFDLPIKTQRSSSTP